MDKHGRVRLVIAECGSAGLYETHDDAFDGLNEIINLIEDRYSPDDYDPQGRSANRIYGPSRKYAQLTDFEGLIEYGHVGHVTLINWNGAFMILDRKGRVLLDKPGADGSLCPRG